jgi:hypothetical protein
MPKKFANNANDSQPESQRNLDSSYHNSLDDTPRKFHHESSGLPDLTPEYLAFLNLEELHHVLNGARRRELSVSEIRQRAIKDLRMIKAEFKRRNLDYRISAPTAISNYPQPFLRNR